MYLCTKPKMLTTHKHIRSKVFTFKICVCVCVSLGVLLAREYNKEIKMRLNFFFE